MEPTPKPLAYAGLFLVALATLMYEVLLTRIFSVTMWYHYAFAAISIAMLGMTAGANLVLVAPRFFTAERTARHLAHASLAFAILIVTSFLTHLSIPFAPNISVVGLYSVALTCAVLAAPFVMSGIAVTLALTRFPARVSRLYAADLLGGATGCAALVLLLRVTDAPTAVVAVAALAALGGLAFAGAAGSARAWRAALATTLALAGLAAGNTALVHRQASLLRLAWIKGGSEPKPRYEKWNSFSRLTVVGDPGVPTPPSGWGLSAAVPRDRAVRQLFLLIDATAATVLTGYDGRPETLQHLKYDVVNAAHFLRRNARVLAIGSGGGRDVLAALAFGQRAVTGVEVNEDILRTVNGVYGDFTGHLDRDPRVTFVRDEARSYVARSRETYDIITLSLIDTWAATAAGAFVLTENGLYTVEAWRLLLDHLTPGGILTVSRYYFWDRPDETYRATALAAASLLAGGVRDPERHIAVLARRDPANRRPVPVDIGTVLVGKAPFSERDLDLLESVARELQFDLVASPRGTPDPVFAELASARSPAFAARFPIDISAPTDDRPFFFHMLRAGGMFDRSLWQLPVMRINLQAVFVLGALLVAVAALAALSILLPLALVRRGAPREALGSAWPLLAYFAAIGLGFMLVEIAQMQRLTLFLGHPTYGLTVVLASLLAASGAGSALTHRVASPPGPAAARWLTANLAGLVLLGIATPLAARAFEGAATPVRIAIAAGLLVPAGVLMGTAFPLGMKLAAARAPALTPWLWGVNGATSVVASVAAVVIALNAGIGAAFWTGWAAYAAALVALAAAQRPRARG